MKKLYSIPKAVAVTVGLNLLLLVVLFLFTKPIQREIGQALLFLTLTLLLTAGVCLFAGIPVRTRGILWACMGISFPIHLILSLIVTLTAGKALSDEWPGGTGNNLAQPLILLMSLAVWYIGILTVTAVRSYRKGRVIREEKRQVKGASKGYRREYTPLSPARARLLAVLRGVLWVLWTHILTILLYDWLTDAGLADTMLSYIAFPVLWSLMAAVYGLFGRQSRIALTLSAAAANLLLVLLPTTLLTVSNTPIHKYRFVLHLDSLLTAPFNNPDQMLVIGVFLSVWVAMIVFGAGHRKKRDV